MSDQVKVDVQEETELTTMNSVQKRDPVDVDPSEEKKEEEEKKDVEPIEENKIGVSVSPAKKDLDSPVMVDTEKLKEHDEKMSKELTTTDKLDVPGKENENEEKEEEEKSSCCSCFGKKEKQKSEPPKVLSVSQIQDEIKNEDKRQEERKKIDGREEQQTELDPTAKPITVEKANETQQRLAGVEAKKKAKKGGGLCDCFKKKKDMEESKLSDKDLVINDNDTDEVKEAKIKLKKKREKEQEAIAKKLEREEDDEINKKLQEIENTSDGDSWSLICVTNIRRYNMPILAICALMGTICMLMAYLKDQEQLYDVAVDWLKPAAFFLTFGLFSFFLNQKTYEESATIALYQILAAGTVAFVFMLMFGVMAVFYRDGARGEVLSIVNYDKVPVPGHIDAIVQVSFGLYSSSNTLFTTEAVMPAATAISPLKLKWTSGLKSTDTGYDSTQGNINGHAPTPNKPKANGSAWDDEYMWAATDGTACTDFTLATCTERDYVFGDFGAGSWKNGIYSKAYRLVINKNILGRFPNNYCDAYGSGEDVTCFWKFELELPVTDTFASNYKTFGDFTVRVTDGGNARNDDTTGVTLGTAHGSWSEYNIPYNGQAEAKTQYTLGFESFINIKGKERNNWTVTLRGAQDKMATGKSQSEVAGKLPSSIHVGFAIPAEKGVSIQMTTKEERLSFTLNMVFTSVVAYSSGIIGLYGLLFSAKWSRSYFTLWPVPSRFNPDKDSDDLAEIREKILNSSTRKNTKYIFTQQKLAEIGDNGGGDAGKKSSQQSKIFSDMVE